MEVGPEAGENIARPLVVHRKRPPTLAEVAFFSTANGGLVVPDKPLPGWDGTPHRRRLQFV